MDYRNNVFIFKTKEDAQRFIDQALKIFVVYKRVTLADLYDLVGKCGDYLSNKVVWCTESEMILSTKYDSYKDWWYVKFPEPDQYPATAKKTYVAPKQTPTPEPINITINIQPFNEVDYTTVREVIQQANEIKDRPVFITIN